MASQITATLPTLNFPREVDYPTQEDWAAFSAAAELNFGILGGSWSTQMQLWKDQANAMSTELNTSADIVQGLANYQGDWTSKGYTLGQSVSVSGVYYICKLTHSTGQNPTVVNSLYWNLALSNWNLKADKTEVALKANIASPAFTGTPTSPTPATGDNSTKLATTAFVSSSVGVANSALVKTALNASGTAPIYACRAWVNFNGTGIVAIRASGNVSSITDNGVGDYTVNFITDMSDTNYVCNGTAKQNSDNTPTITVISTNSFFTTSIRLLCSNRDQTPIDAVFINSSIFR